MDRKSGIQQLLGRWKMQPDATHGGSDPCDPAFLRGLHCRQGKGGWAQIQRYNRPVLIELTNQPAQAYALLTGLGSRYATLTNDAVSISVLRHAIDPEWRGSFLFLWKPPADGDTLIGPGASQKYVTWIQQTLARIPDFQSADPPSKKYDALLQDAVRRFQRQQGLTPDGLVGPETIIALNTQAATPGIPRLEQAE
jgi:general secretion pathway protein A